MWWFLAKDDYEQDRPAVAFGPYPSEEFCRLAAHDLIRDDRRFWTDDERAEGERRDRELRDALIAQSTVREGWVKVDEHSSVYLDKDGKQTSWSGGEMTVSYAMSHSWRAITGCVEIDTPSGVA